jgi:hypothetical protein
VHAQLNHGIPYQRLGITPQKVVSRDTQIREANLGEANCEEVDGLFSLAGLL